MNFFVKICKIRTWYVRKDCMARRPPARCRHPFSCSLSHFLRHPPPHYFSSSWILLKTSAWRLFFERDYFLEERCGLTLHPFRRTIVFTTDMEVLWGAGMECLW